MYALNAFLTDVYGKQRILADGVVLHGREIDVPACALTRVALQEGSLAVNSSQGGGGKDMWILE